MPSNTQTNLATYNGTNFMPKRTFFSVSFFSAFLLIAPTIQANPYYRVTEFAVQNTGGQDLQINNIVINNSGQIAGIATHFVNEQSSWVPLAFLGANGAISTYFLPGGDVLHGSSITAINDKGQVTGQSSTFNNSSHAFLINGFDLTGNRVIKGDLGTLGGKNSIGKDINSKGQVVGTSETSTGLKHAFVTVNGKMKDLGVLEPGTESEGYAINEKGQVTGVAWINGGLHAFVTIDGVMKDLGTLGGWLSQGMGINNKGQVFGSSIVHDYQGDQHAFVTKNGVMIDLGTLGGMSCETTDINEKGQVVGNSITANGEFHAFVTDKNMMVDLGVLGGAISKALAINTNGQVVGWSTNNLDPFSRAFVTIKGVMTDLNNLIPKSLGVTLYMATAINDKGQISAAGINANGEIKVFLLSPAK